MIVDCRDSEERREIVVPKDGLVFLERLVNPVTRVLLVPLEWS